MTVASRAWGRLSIPGRLVFIGVPVLLALTIALTGGPTRAQTAAAEKPPSVKPLSVKPMYGMSLYGDLKYPEGFRHFDYVNPDAPKGGVFSQDFIESYIELKMSDVYAFEHTPHPVEFKMYYSV